MKFRKLLPAVMLATGLILPARGALGDDLADEAELQFSLGAADYQRGNFTSALEHFLTSNRLVTNKNVIYNIARCFEQLGKYPEAFRYFDLALSGEVEPSAVTTIEQALARISSKVAVLSVRSHPPGATLYVDRKDLGPRGATPRRLGLPSGKYTIVAELPGYYPAQVQTKNLTLGETYEVELNLEQILGKLQVLGQPGTRVRVDDGAASKQGQSPCELMVAPGHHVLYFSRDGYESAAVEVDTAADYPTVVTPRLNQLSGSVVVSTDEPNALVEIDGSPRGFTPAVVTVPVGEHRVRVTREGYKAVERVVHVKVDEQARLGVEMAASEQVAGASRRVESVEDTASSVTIVPRQEIQALAYPTLAEALRGQPGVYFWDDRGYIGIGMRGLGRLNSYGNRVLVLLDGVPMNDDWMGSAYVGFDLMTDLNNIERIEVIRGPGSAVYGTSAFSGVVNLVSRSKGPSGVEAGLGTSLDGVSRARARGSLEFGRKGNLFVSASIGRSRGRDFYFPEYAAPGTPSRSDEPGWARGLDGMRSATIQGQASHGPFAARWSWHRHQKDLPSAPFDTWFGDPRAQQTDERGFLELRADPKVSSATTATTRAVLNRYTFRGRYPREVSFDAVRQVPTDGLEVDSFRGHWVTVEQRFVHDFSERLHLTVGGEGSYHFDVQQSVRDISGSLLDGGQNRYRVVAGYGIFDMALGSRMKVSLGGRVDHYSTFGASINPRVGVVLRPYEAGNTKLNVGRAFRAPSIYELYYNDGGLTQQSSPSLKPETLLSAEVEHVHHVSPTVSLSLGVYVNTVRDLIDTRGGGTPANPIHFVNTSNPIAVVGTEFGLKRDWRSGYMAQLTYGYSRAQMLADGRVNTLLTFEERPDFRNVANSPTHAATFKGVAPFLLKGVSLGTRVSLQDRRWDRYELAGDVAQQRSQAAVIWDLVLSAEDEKRRIRAAFGVYNLLDWVYRYPVGSEYEKLRTIPGGGRSILVSLETRI